MSLYNIAEAVFLRKAFAGYNLAKAVDESDIHYNENLLRNSHQIEFEVAAVARLVLARISNFKIPIITTF